MERENKLVLEWEKRKHRATLWEGARLSPAGGGRKGGLLAATASTQPGHRKNARVWDDHRSPAFVLSLKGA